VFILLVVPSLRSKSKITR